MLVLEPLQRLGRFDRRAEAELDAEARDRGGLGRQRLAQLAVRRDREADEAADLLARVVDRDVVAEQRELAGAREPGRAGADDGDALAGPLAPRARTKPRSNATSVA